MDLHDLTSAWRLARFGLVAADRARPSGRAQCRGFRSAAVRPDRRGEIAQQPSYSDNPFRPR
ncbi:MAG: hypothetical protein DLM61_10195 [Pseudonocardiales bacterium]|nr:MAG: hypothetical protein DLM61_10195 [Pseudonocardiales bacterium]